MLDADTTFSALSEPPAPHAACCAACCTACPPCSHLMAWRLLFGCDSPCSECSGSNDAMCGSCTRFDSLPAPVPLHVCRPWVRSRSAPSRPPLRLRKSPNPRCCVFGACTARPCNSWQRQHGVVTHCKGRHLGGALLGLAPRLHTTQPHSRWQLSFVRLLTTPVCPF
jgi:hypothetical protein